MPLLLPLALLCLHTALVVAAVLIEKGPGWDDQSPTILVLMALSYLDYPLKLFHQFQSWWSLAMAGGGFWFGAGLVLQMGARLISRRWDSSRRT